MMSMPSDVDSLDRFNDWLKPKTKHDLHRTESGLDSGRPDDATAVEVLPAAPEPVELSPIAITCPDCNDVLYAPGDSGGQLGRCPSCGNVLPIPVPAAKPIELWSMPRAKLESQPSSPTSSTQNPVPPPPESQSTASVPDYDQPLVTIPHHPASQQPKSSGFDSFVAGTISTFKDLFKGPFGAYILLTAGIPFAGLIFYNCLGGGSSSPTKKPYLTEKFETFKPKGSK